MNSHSWVWSPSLTSSPPGTDLLHCLWLWVFLADHQWCVCVCVRVLCACVINVSMRGTMGGCVLDPRAIHIHLKGKVNKLEQRKGGIRASDFKPHSLRSHCRSLMVVYDVIHSFIVYLHKNPQNGITHVYINNERNHITSKSRASPDSFEI